MALMVKDGAKHTKSRKQDKKRTIITKMGQIMEPKRMIRWRKMIKMRQVTRCRKNKKDSRKKKV